MAHAPPMPMASTRNYSHFFRGFSAQGVLADKESLLRRDIFAIEGEHPWSQVWLVTAGDGGLGHTVCRRQRVGHSCNGNGYQWPTDAYRRVRVSSLAAPPH